MGGKEWEEDGRRKIEDSGIRGRSGAEKMKERV